MVIRVFERRLERRGERAEQRQPCDRCDDALRRQGHERAERRRTDPDADRDEARRHARDPATASIRPCFRTCRQRGADRCEVDAVATGRRGDHRSQACDHDRSTPRHLISQPLHDGHAGDVLRGHRHQVEGHRDSHDRLHCELRRDEFQTRHDRRRIHLGTGRHHVHEHDCRRHEERGRHCPAGKESHPDQPHEHDGNHPGGIRHRSRDRAQTQLQQHAGEHRLRHRCGNPRDESAQRRHEPRHDDEQSGDQERSHRSGPPALHSPRRHKECGPWGRPRHRDGQLRPPRKDDRPHTHEHGDGHETAGGLHGSRTDGGEPRQHDHERTGEGDESGNEARRDRLSDGLRPRRRRRLRIMLARHEPSLPQHPSTESRTSVPHRLLRCRLSP